MGKLQRDIHEAVKRALDERAGEGSEAAAAYAADLVCGLLDLYAFDEHEDVTGGMEEFIGEKCERDGWSVAVVDGNGEPVMEVDPVEGAFDLRPFSACHVVVLDGAGDGLSFGDIVREMESGFDPEAMADAQIDQWRERKLQDELGR